MLAQIVLILSKKWKKIARKERRPLPTTLYNFTLSPYFMRKETGIPISSPDAKAWNAMIVRNCRFIMTGKPGWEWGWGWRVNRAVSYGPGPLQLQHVQ